MKVLFQLLFGAGLLHSLLRLLFLSGALYFLLRSAVTIVRTSQLGKKSGETDQNKNGTELGTETQIASHGRDSGNRRIAGVIATLFIGVLCFSSGLAIGEAHGLKRNLQIHANEYAAWKVRSENYQRMLAIWLEQHPQYKQVTK